MKTLKVTDRLSSLVRTGNATTYNGAQIHIQLRIIKNAIKDINDAYVSESNRAYVGRRLETLDACIANISALVLDMELKQ